MTIAWVETIPCGDSLTVRFTTATESGNAGFRIWGTRRAGRAGAARDGPVAGLRQLRAAALRDGRAAPGIRAIEIEDVSVFGKNRLHGPFAVGATFGEEPEAARIDWAAIKAEAGLVSALDRVAAAEIGDPERLAQIAGREGLLRTGPVERSGLLLVRHEGIHRVTYEELLAAGIDLAGVAPARIALVDNGVGMPRFVSTRAACSDRRSRSSSWRGRS